MSKFSEIAEKLSEDSEEGDLVRGYISLGFFLLVLVVALITKPAIPIQTILIATALVIMVIGNGKIQDLVAGVILHPIMAMTAGFIVAGALELAGGFDALLHFLQLLTGTPLGLIGVAVILANIPTIMPMPCGRILAVAMMPGVLRYADYMAQTMVADGLIPEARAALVMPALLAAFIVNGAASCGPSPLGGIGGIGEGNLGVQIGSSGASQSMGIMMASGLTALIIAFVQNGFFV